MEKTKLLTAQNKWLIAHEETQIPGAFCGLVGENITLKWSKKGKDGESNE